MRILAFASALLSLMLVISGCQTSHGSADRRSFTAEPPSDHPGKFATGDLLDVVYFDLTVPERRMDFPVRVTAQGTVPLPFLGDVKVAGLMPSELERGIYQAFRDNNDEAGTHFNVRRLRTAAQQLGMHSRIGKYDLVRIVMWDLSWPNSETIQISRVEPDGRIAVPYLGGIKLAGLTEGEAEQELIKAYRDANLVQNLLVSVLILESAPPNAEKLDLPDMPIHPVPAGFEWLYDDHSPAAPPATIASATTKESSPPDDSQSRLAPTASGASETDEKLQTIFDEAVRAHAAGVAKYTLPKSSAEYVRDHGYDAMGFLENQLVSEDASIQAAAFDFIAELSSIPSVHQRAHVAKLRLLFHAACMRDNHPGRQAPPLPDEDVQCFRDDPAATMQFLKPKLLFAKPAIQMTALQFVLKIADIPAIHDWAMCVMREAIESGPAARKLVKSTYEELLKKDAEAKIKSAPCE